MRCEFVYTVAAPIGPYGALIPVDGVSVTVWEVNSDGTVGNQIVPFAERAGSEPSTATATDENGGISFWLEPGDYQVNFVDQRPMPRIDPFPVGFSSVPATSLQNPSYSVGGGTGSGGDVTATSTTLQSIQVLTATASALLAPTIPVYNSVDVNNNPVLVRQIDCSSFGGLQVGDIVQFFWGDEITNHNSYAAVLGNFIDGTNDPGKGVPSTVTGLRSVKAATERNITSTYHNSDPVVAVEIISDVSKVTRYYNFYMYGSASAPAAGDILNVEAMGNVTIVVLRPANTTVVTGISASGGTTGGTTGGGTTGGGTTGGGTTGGGTTGGDTGGGTTGGGTTGGGTTGGTTPPPPATNTVFGGSTGVFGGTGNFGQ